MKFLALLTVVLSFTLNFLYSQNTDSLYINKKDSTNVQTKILPFTFYHNSVGWVLGAFSGIKGFAQEQTQAKVGGMISTNKSYYGFLQIEDLQAPFFPRLYFRPDIYIGKLGEIKEYIGSANSQGITPGSNESGKSDYILLKGNDVWLEFNFKYLLPIGDGDSTVILRQKFKDGILVSGEAGGKEYNPLKSGRTYLGAKLIYRSLKLKNDAIDLKLKTAAIDFALSYENMDYFFNPTIGSMQKISYTKDWGTLGSNSKSDVIKLDMRWYIPLFDRQNSTDQRVLALNFYTSDIPSWNDYDLIDGKRSYHRPQLFAGSNLGGVKYLRSYKDFRYYDKSLIYYSAELRQKLPWNPFNNWDLTKNIGVDFLQAVAFFDLGRVAPEWKLSTLHSNMQYSAGGGIRLFVGGIVARLDVAAGKEGVLTQMFIDHPF